MVREGMERNAREEAARRKRCDGRSGFNNETIASSWMASSAAASSSPKSSSSSSGSSPAATTAADGVAAVAYERSSTQAAPWRRLRRRSLRSLGDDLAGRRALAVSKRGTAGTAVGGSAGGGEEKGSRGSRKVRLQGSRGGRKEGEECSP
jgi:hypothetical protein